MTSQTQELDELVVAYQDPLSRRWGPVGRLSCKEGFYHFQYTRGAVEASEAGSFLPFREMTDFETIYRSEKLFPLFQNRIMPRTRPEYNDYTRWLLGESGELSPLRELGRSGGARATDTIQLYPIPKNINGSYQVSFFAHGVRHLPGAAQEAIDAQGSGRQLLLMHDMQNEHDPNALALRTEFPPVFVGYCPRFLSEDFLYVMKSDSSAKVILAQVNTDAPLQFRYRCEFIADWPDGFKPFDTEAFQVVSNEIVRV